MRLSRYLARERAVRKESLVSVNSLDSQDVVGMGLCRVL